MQQFYFKKLRTTFLETECGSEQEVPDFFFMKFKRTHTAVASLLRVLLGQDVNTYQFKKGNQEHKA